MRVTRSLSQVTEITYKAGDRKLVVPGGLLLRLGGLHLFARSCKILAGFQRLGHARFRIKIVQRRIGCKIGQAELLVERKTDYSRECQFIFGEFVLGGNESLLL